MILATKHALKKLKYSVFSVSSPNCLELILLNNSAILKLEVQFSEHLACYSYVITSFKPSLMITYTIS